MKCETIAQLQGDAPENLWRPVPLTVAKKKELKCDTEGWNNYNLYSLLRI